MDEFVYSSLSGRVRAAKALLAQAGNAPTAWAPPEMPFDQGGEGRFPALHERQIDRHAGLRLDHAERLQAHIRRVQRELLLLEPNDRSAPLPSTRGRARRVWCMERRTVFASVALAARAVDRAPSNILQAIRLGYQCAGLHWSYFDPAKHSPALQPARNQAVNNEKFPNPIITLFSPRI